MTDYWRTELKRIADKCAETPDRVVVDELRNAVLFLYEIVKDPEFKQLKLDDVAKHRHGDDKDEFAILMEEDLKCQYS